MWVSHPDCDQSYFKLSTEGEKANCFNKQHLLNSNRSAVPESVCNGMELMEMS